MGPLLQIPHQQILSRISALVMSFAFRSAVLGLALGLLVTPIYADSGLGTQIKEIGIITHVDRNGVFSIEGSPYKRYSHLFTSSQSEKWAIP